MKTEKITEPDQEIIDQVDSSLQDGRIIRNWWQQANSTATPAYEESFTLIENYHDRGGATGFRNSVEVDGKSRPFVGADQVIFFDHIQPLEGPEKERKSDLLWVRGQLRAFTFNSFLRVLKLARPQRYPLHRESSDNPRLFANLSLWPKRDINITGSGALQLYFKEKSGGKIGKFSEQAQYSIKGLETLDKKYQWLVFQLQLFENAIEVQPFGRSAPQAKIFTPQTPYMAACGDFVIDETYDWDKCGDDDPIGEYGCAFAFISPQRDNLTVYGPDNFAPGFTEIKFRLYKNGRIEVLSSFVVPEPDSLVEVPVTMGLDVGIRIADTMSFGIASKVFSPMRRMIQQLPGANIRFDPVTPAVRLADAMTLGFTGTTLGYSTDVFSRLVCHEYCLETLKQINNARRTWNRVADWTEDTGIPDWIQKGRISLDPDLVIDHGA